MKAEQKVKQVYLDTFYYRGCYYRGRIYDVFGSLGFRMCATQADAWRRKRKLPRSQQMKQGMRRRNESGKRKR